MGEQYHELLWHHVALNMKDTLWHHLICVALIRATLICMPCAKPAIGVFAFHRLALSTFGFG